METVLLTIRDPQPTMLDEEVPLFLREIAVRHGFLGPVYCEMDPDRRSSSSTSLWMT